MNKERVLADFGLTEAEVSLYVALLKLGEASASALAERTNTNRTFTYDRLKRLLGSGLVSYVVKDNKKYFRAAEPSRLLSILQEKEEQVKSILPELERLKVPEKKGPDVEIFSSKKGVRTALNMALKEKKDLLIHGSIKKFREMIPSYYEIWNKRRSEEKIQAKVLSAEDVDVPFAETELLPEEEQSALTTFTFGKYTLIVLWSDIPVAILIDSPAIAKDNAAFFNNIWEREIKIYSGVVGIQRAWMELVKERSKELVGFGFSWALAQIYGRGFSDEWHKQRVENNIPARLISYDDERSKRYFDMRMIDWKDFRISFLDKDLCGPVCVVLSDRLIVNFLYTEKRFKVIVSKNREMISVYKKHFENLWKRSKSKKTKKQAR